MIYTKTGDKGETSLANGQRVAKTDVRIEAYGTVDELNSWVGALRAVIFSCPASDTRDRSALESSDQQLALVQNQLFNLGAALSEAPGVWITDEDVNRIENWIDGMQAVVPQQRAFILPSGSEAVTRCHVCRTICRRAERRMIEAKASELTIRYINRLSDYFFVLSRFICFQNGETENVWKKA